MEHRRFRRVLLSSLVALVAWQVQAETSQLPRLVVCITVDQLRSDYLEELQPMLGSQGIKLMLDRGHYTRDVRFPLYQINAASAVASIFTGTYPNVHGIEGPTVYLRGQQRSQPIFWDEAYRGNYTRDALSPNALLVGTLGDRFKEASNGTALVYSVAPDAEQALVSAGTLADGAYWIDNAIGSWCTTSYYPQMPAPLEQYNRSSEGPNKRLLSGSMLWKPLRSYSTPQVSFSTRSKAFGYRYQGADAPRFKQSALVNEEITTFAIQLIEHAGYEHRKAPGLLSLTYTTAPQTSEELSAEDIDTYVRLDEQLARLLTTLDKKIGLDNCLISLSGTGYTTYKPYAKMARTGEAPKQSLSVERLSALTNMYLTAAYGAGDWIEANSNGRLYLNHKLIENKKLRIADLQSEVADFLKAADGVGEAYSALALHRGLSSEEAIRLAQSIHSRYEADVYWTLLPGWSVEEASKHPRLQHISTAIPSPFIIMGRGVELRKLAFVPTEARDLVRVICSVLRIRPPNAAR